jgi:CRISPR/Cas system-associated endoribonuclease Cas2
LQRTTFFELAVYVWYWTHFRLCYTNQFTLEVLTSRHCQTMSSWPICIRHCIENGVMSALQRSIFEGELNVLPLAKLKVAIISTPVRVRSFKISSRTWLVRQWFLRRTCAKTNSVLNVYLVFKNKVHKVQVSEKYVQTTR